MTKVLVIAAIFLAAVVPADAALRASPQLQAIANDFRGLGHPVLCEDDQAAWDADPQKLGRAGVTYFNNEIHLSPRVCRTLEGPTLNPAYAAQAHVLIHELIHSVGILDEAQTDCLALGVHYQFVRRYLKATHIQAMVSWRIAWDYHASLSAPYQATWCQRPPPEAFIGTSSTRVTTKVVKQCYQKINRKLKRIPCPG